MNIVKRVTLSILPWAVVLFVAIFFYRALSDNWHNLNDVSFSFNIWSLLGIVLFTAAVAVSGVLWGHLLSVLSGKKIKTIDAVRIHSASWLLKYIPGQVGSYINKIAWGIKQGVSKKTISTSFIYENVLMVFAGFLLSIPVFMLFRDKLNDGLSILLPLLVLVPMLIVMSRPVFYKLLNFIFTKLKRKPFKDSDFLSSKKLIDYQIGYLLPRLLNGVGFVFIVISILDVDPSQYIGLASIYILASIIGLLAIFVPGGLGVREAVIVMFASVYFPLEQAIIISLITRLYATISDAGVGVVYLILNKGKVKQL